MSAAEHEAAAKQHEAAGAAHEEHHDASATSMRERRHAVGGTLGRAESISGVGTGVCWTSVTNPTDAHRRVAEEHRKHAADHRAGAVALGAAEARACVGISTTIAT